ncbi:hypothetical protein ASPCADRAFT_508653 [Aspergillus carbonarius ITEM 5010]|uniref:Uncharacterized protein n=1 Tax=Aspergillus carbonarius (strain ITEM 5010) TaxID=602072 RepID=A0A1R3RGC6_ASPC5|nr:hypothetical protein ASPCADRAFT_508653 [Aspergillus carbonarius ITEM 5010]
MPKLTDKDYEELEVGLGPLGWGIYYVWNAFADEDHPEWRGGVDLTGWCLAYNHDDDLIFLKTENYNSAYFKHNSAPGGTHYTWTGFSVKSRESDAQFMVMRPDGGDCDRNQMIEYARRWSGYLVTGQEKEYYMALIQAAREQQAQQASN